MRVRRRRNEEDREEEESMGINVRIRMANHKGLSFKKKKVDGEGGEGRVARVPAEAVR